MDVKNKNILSKCNLQNMDDDCPWKEYENFSSEVFIKENFKPLRKYCNIFEETLPYVCKEIVFLKVYMEFF